MKNVLQEAINRNRQDGYLLYHAPRYDMILDLLDEYFSEGMKILDVGRSPFTEIASQFLSTPIDTLGFEDDKKTETGYNYHFDLNDSQHSDKWRKDIPQYDIIIFSEVIEHLHTSPELVLKFLKFLLKEDGIIILQTPNAVALHKRIKMLFGRNPYHLISKNTENPAHFREYTAEELMKYCNEVGFKVEKSIAGNYFDYRYRDHAKNVSQKSSFYGILNTVYKIIPDTLKPGLCFVLRAS